MSNENKNNHKVPSLLKSSLLIGIMTMLSRILGLARDVIIAGYFGSSASADAFIVAFKIPNLFRRLFAEGAFSQSFVPILSEYRQQRSYNEVKELISCVAGTLAGLLFIITILCILASPVLIRLFAPGFVEYPTKLELAEKILKITFPYLLLISLTALAGSILNTYNKFIVPAFTPVLLNLSLITSTVFLTPWFNEPIMALAWGVVIAGLSQLLLQIPFLLQIQLLPTLKWRMQDEGVKRIMKLMIPTLFSLSVSQINLLLDIILASFLETGSVSWLYYSERLSELPLGVFGIAIATVILSNLSSKHTEHSYKQFSKTLDWALRLILVIGLPASIALFILSEQLLATLFNYGEMENRDIVMAGMSLRAYSFGLIAFMLIKVLAPGYFARQDTKTPVKIAIISMIVNMFFNLILVYWLQHVGLALATTLSAFLNAGLLFFGLKRTGVFEPESGWLLYIGQLLIASTIMALVLFLIVGDLHGWLDATTFWQRVLKISQVIIAGLSVYGATLLLSGLRPNHFKY